MSNNFVQEQNTLKILQNAERNLAEKLQYTLLLPLRVKREKNLSLNYKAKNSFFNGVIQAKRLFGKVF